MKKKYLITVSMISLVIIGIIILYSYRLRPVHYKPEDVISMNDTRPMEELKKLVLSKGDTTAYNELRIAYLDVKYYGQEYLLYSIIMADKYKYTCAYFDVYYSLISIFRFHHYTGEIDKKTLALALKYLKEGVELNDSQSINELGKLYLEGKYVPKDTVLGKKLLKKAKLWE